MIDPAPISYGPPGGRVLYLAFERDFGPPWLDAVVRRVSDLFYGLGVRATNRRPKDWPGTYGTVVIAWELPGGRPGFGARDDFWLPGGDDVNPRVVFALSMADPLLTAAYAGHEAGHGAGLGHDTAKGSLMNEGLLTNGSVFTGVNRMQILARTGAKP